MGGVVADVISYEPADKYDVIVLDKVLHMFKHDDERRAVLEKVSTVTKSEGFILIADTPKNQPLIRSFFENHSENWKKTKDSKGFIFEQKQRTASRR